MQWSPIPGWHGYEITKSGKIRGYKKAGHPGSRHKKPKIMKPQLFRLGYFVIRLSLNGKRYALNLHTLVLLTFSGPAPEKGMHGAHLNGNKKDNRIENLKWVTAAENSKHRILHGTMLYGEKHPRSKLSDKNAMDIIQKYKVLFAISKSRNNGIIKTLAKEFAVSVDTIQKTVNGKLRSNIIKG